MKIKHSSTAKEGPVYIGLLKGLAVSMALTLLCAGVLAWLIETERLQESAVAYGALIILLISAAAGAWMCTRTMNQNKLIACLLSGGSYFLMLLACTALFFGGQYQGVAVTGLCVIGAAMCVGIIGLKGKGSTNPYKKRKYR